MKSRISYGKASVICAVYIAVVFACFGDALTYYFTKEDFRVLDVGSANKFVEQIAPNAMIYRPLANYGYFAVGRLLFGLDPRLWHLSNLLLHALAGFAVFLFVRKITSDMLIGFFAGLFYLTNLVNYHSIYWVTCATQTLALLAAMAVWLLYLSARGPGIHWVTPLCIVAFALALLTNEVNVSIPAMLTIYWWMFLRKSADGKALVSLTLWLWGILICYLLLRVAGYWLGEGETYRHFYDMRLRSEIPRNIAAMITMVIDPLYLLSNILTERGVLTKPYKILWNWVTGMLVILAVTGCYLKRDAIRRAFRTPDHSLRYVVFGLIWSMMALIPSSHIFLPAPWRTNLAVVGYALVLACCISRLSTRRVYHGTLIAALILWGWWGMHRIRDYDVPFIQIHRYQMVCRNIAEDITFYLEQYPDVEELHIPSYLVSQEFYFATFACQQFHLLLPKRVTFLYSPYDHDNRKSMMILLYSEEDTHLYLEKIVRPGQG